MPLDGLIPIGGGSGGNSGSKRGGSSDLTGGLISLSGARDNVDVDMSDFDVGDLLGDDSSKSKSKSSSKSTSGDKKKKKSKDKEKSKKSKSKSKKSAFDDDNAYGNDDGNDWTTSTKNWDSAVELEMAAAAAARRKNGGGGLDGEFAQMLGLDSGGIGGGADFGLVEPPPLSPELTVEVNRDDKIEPDDPFGISGYTPTVRGSKKSESADVTSPVEESTKGGSGEISAFFFQDDGKGDLNSSSLSSLLGSSSERRGGARGGRRQASGAESDPFGLGSTTTSNSNLDSLFGGSSSRRSALDDPFAKPARELLDDYDSRQKGTKDPVEEREAKQIRAALPSARDAVPASKILSAKDDLLADLFPSEPRSSARGDQRQPESPFSKVDDGNDYEKKTIAPESASTILAVDPTKQQNDLLAEMFATPYSTKTASYDKPKEEAQEQEQRLKPSVVEEKSVTPPRENSPPPKKVESLVDSSLSFGNTNADLASARDSLLMDLLGDLSPPKPVLLRRRSRSNNSSPDKEVVKGEDPFKSSLPPSPIQAQPLAIVPEAFAETPPVLSTIDEKPDTPPSPGRRRRIAMDKGALTIRESDFEQSKDSLLEEILPSSPSISARSSPYRRNSYSQSFDVEDSIVAEADKEYVSEVVEEQKPQVQEEPPTPEPPASESPAPISTVIIASSPPQPELKSDPEVRSLSKPKPFQHQTDKTIDVGEEKAVLVPACNCEEREAKLATAFEVERAALQQKLDELTQQLDNEAVSSSHTMQQLTQQLEEREASFHQLSQQLEARVAANAQLARQLAAAERDKLQADQLVATSKDDAANYQHRAGLLEAELRGLREELSRSKRAVQDAELALARKTAQQDEAEQLERHREKRALEALSAQMQRALARLTISHQVQEEGPGYDNSAARVAAEDEARLRVIASLEGSSKRAVQYAEQERVKLAELLRELEVGARNARQGALEDKERLRQEQQRLDALSAHLQAQAAALRDQEAAHAAYMGQQLAEAREDARVYEARLTTRRTQLERDERALYEARAEFAAFREQTALEIERDHEELRASRLALEDAWRELRADHEDLEAELASHEDEFQTLENMRQEVQEAEARLAERTQDVVALAEKLDAGTRDLLEREQIVAQQAAVVQGTDTSFANRERALERVKNELEAREQRLHVQIRQLDSARGRLTQQRREQQQLLTAARRQFFTAQQPVKVVVDNYKLWRRSDFTSVGHRSSTISNNFNHSSPVVDKLWETGLHVEEDPSGLSPALRKQVEANWQRRNQQGGQQRQSSGLTFDLSDFDATRFPSSSPMKTKDVETLSYISNVDNTVKPNSTSAQQNHSEYTDKKLNQSQAALQQRANSISLTANSFRAPNARAQALHSQQPPPPPSARSTGTFQPTLRVNL